jgi:hypothetical protein
MTQNFYKASKNRFDNDPEFKERAQQGVVRLQVSRSSWVLSLGRLACSHPSNVLMCREGRRNIEKHGKRFVTSAGANLTWCTSA